MGLFNYFKELLGKDSETENEDVYVADSRTKHSDEGERADTVGGAEEITGFGGREIADNVNASEKGHGSTVIGENGLIKDKNSLADLLEKEGDQRSNRIDHEESVDTDFSEENLGEDSGDDFNISEPEDISDDKPGVWGDVEEDVDDVFDSSDLEELRKGSDGVSDNVEGFDSSASGVGEDQKFENSPAESGASVVKSGDGIISGSDVEDRESDVPVVKSGDGIVSDSGVPVVESDTSVVKSDVEDRESDVPVIKSGDGIVSDSGVEDRESGVPVVESDTSVVKSDVEDRESDVPVVESDTSVVKSDVEDRESDVPVVESDTSVVKSDVEDRESDVPVVESDTSVVKSDVEDRESDVPVIKSGDGIVSDSGVEDRESDVPVVESDTSVVKSGDGIVSNSDVPVVESDTSVVKSDVEDRESDVPVVKSGDGIVSDSDVPVVESDTSVVKSENLPAESDNTDDYLVAETTSNDDTALNETTATPEPGAVVSDSENSDPSPAVDEVTVPGAVGSGVVAGTSGGGVDFVEGEQVESVQDSSVAGSSVPWSVYLARQSEQVVGEADNEGQSVSTVGSEKDLDSADSQEDMPDASAPGLEGSRGLELSSDGEGAEVGEPSDLLDEDEGGEFVETDGDSGVVKSELEVDPSLVRGGSDEDDSKGDGGLHISIPGF